MAALGARAGRLTALLFFGLLAAGIAYQLWVGARTGREARELNLAAFDEAWTLIGERHFDPGLGGVDWSGVREELRPRMARTRSRDEGREVLAEMLARLGQSHFGLIPAEALAAKSYANEAGSTGLDLRIVDGQVVVTAVAAGSPAERAGIGRGWELLEVDGKRVVDRLRALSADLSMSEVAVSRRALRRTESIRRLLSGPPGSSHRVILEDGEGARVAASLVLDKPPGRLAPAGKGPAGYVEVRAERLESGVRYVGFDGFTYPAYVMRAFNETLEEGLGARGLVIDLRGNGGGMLEMVTGMLGWLFTERRSIGTMVLRDQEIDVLVRPRLQSYAGPVAVLIDELGASGAELFAYGVRALQRGVLVGSATSGSVQGAQIAPLPTGDALAFVMSDIRTLDGESLEGVGVAPDLEVRATRERLLRGEDPVLAAAIEWILRQPQPEGPGCRRKPLRPPAMKRSPVTAEREAAEVLDRFVEVTGGAEAYAALASRTVRALLRSGGEGAAPMHLTIHQARPAHSLKVLESEQLGEVRVGTTDGRAWRADLINGLRWLGPGEEASLLRAARLDGPVRWREEFRKVEYLGLRDRDGRPHHRLRLAAHRGPPEVHWYDAESGLLTYSVAHLSATAGTTRVVTRLSDYRWVDGILLPYRSSLLVLGEEQLMDVESVEHGVALDVELFEVPARLANPDCSGTVRPAVPADAAML